MGETARWIVAVTPPTTAILLLLSILIMVRRVEKSGGYVEVDWKTVAFRIKCSFSPENRGDPTGSQDPAPPAEVSTSAAAPQPPADAAEPPNGGGRP